MPRPKSNIGFTRRPPNPATPIHETMDTLVQGISQQPGHLRLPGQGELQENAWSSPVEGLTKRNPAMLQLVFLQEKLDNFYLEMFRLGDESYSFLILPDDYENTGRLAMAVRNTNGTPVFPKVYGPGLSVNPVTGVVSIDSDSYLFTDPFNDGTTPALFSRFSLINTASGDGALLNRSVTTAMSTELTPARENNGLIFIQAVQYQINYRLTLTSNGETVAAADVTTPAATDDNNQISTTEVATRLTANINSLDGYTAVQSDYVIEVRRDDDQPFIMNLDDGRAGVLGRAFTDRVSTLAELPLRAPNDYLVNIESDPSTDVDDRWVKFTTLNGQEIGEGQWSEAPAPGIPFKLDANTMPYHVKRQGLNDIWIGPADGSTQTIDDESYEFPAWGERTTGNEETVPDPEFVGTTIHDHVFFRERYVLAGGDIVQFSEIGDSFNFFQDSVLSLTDQDGFSVRCASEISSELQWILPIDETLLIWSVTSQFQVRSADSEALTARTAVVVRLSNIVMNRLVKPKLAAAKVLFSTDEYGYSHVREYDFFSNRQARLGLNLGGSNDITLNLPKYIRGLITHWDVSEASDYAVARTPDDPNCLYVYKYQWSAASAGLQKVQASWSKWRFGGEVQWVKFMENNLWIVITFPNRTELQIIKADELVNPANEMELLLDRQLLYPEVNSNPITTDDIVATYDELDNVTTFELPFSAPDGGKIQAVTRFTAEGGSNEGLLLGETTTTTLVCKQPGDWRDVLIGFGEPYQFKYEFNKAYIPEANQANNRRVGKLTGRTQLMTWEIHHRDTGFYQVRVSRANRSEDSVSTFRARTLGVSHNRLDTEQDVIETGTFRVPVYSRNTDCSITVESSSWLPVTVSSCAWEGTYSDRSKG